MNKNNLVAVIGLIATLTTGASAQTFCDIGPALPAASQQGTVAAPRVEPDGSAGYTSQKRYLLDPSVIRLELRVGGISDNTLRDMAAQAFEQAADRAGATVVPNDTSHNDSYIDKVAQNGRYDTGYADTPTRGHYIPANYRVKSLIVTGGRSTDARLNRVDLPKTPVVIDLGQEQLTLHVEVTIERIGTAANSYTMTAESRRHHQQDRLVDVRNNATVRVGGTKFSFNVLEKIAGIRQQQASSSQVAQTMVQDAFNKDIVPQLADQIR